MVVSLMAMRPLLRRFGHAVSKSFSKFRRDSRDPGNKEPRLPSHNGQVGASEDETPLPCNTDRWWKWPVDLDVNLMTVSTKSGSTGTQRTRMSTQMSRKASQMSRKATRHDAGGKGNGKGGGKSKSKGDGRRESEEPLDWMEMDAQEVRLDDSLVLDSDTEGLPYGA
jgi:hypothetical protein